MTPVWDDPRVASGMTDVLERRARAIAAGATPRGWKVALGSPSALAALEIEAPVLGYLTEGSIVASGSECPVGGWTKPSLEPEIAIHIGADVPAGASEEQAAAAIAGLGTAIEIVDVEFPMTELAAVIAGNIYHRAVILGPIDESRAGGDASGIAVRVERDGELIASEDDPCSIVGTTVQIVRQSADLLAAFGAAVSAGDVIISGSTVPLVAVAPGERIACSYGALQPPLEVGFTGERTPAPAAA